MGMAFLELTSLYAGGRWCLGPTGRPTGPHRTPCSCRTTLMWLPAGLANPRYAGSHVVAAHGLTWLSQIADSLRSQLSSCMAATGLCTPQQAQVVAAGAPEWPRDVDEALEVEGRMERACSAQLEVRDCRQYAWATPRPCLPQLDPDRVLWGAVWWRAIAATSRSLGWLARLCATAALPTVQAVPLLKEPACPGGTPPLLGVGAWLALEQSVAVQPHTLEQPLRVGGMVARVQLTLQSAAARLATMACHLLLQLRAEARAVATASMQQLHACTARLAADAARWGELLRRGVAFDAADINPAANAGDGTAALSVPSASHACRVLSHLHAAVQDVLPFPELR